MTNYSRLSVLFFGCALTACVAQKNENVADFYPVSYSQLSGWDHEDFGQLLSLFKQNCQRIDQLAPESHLGGGVGLFGGQVKDWQPACEAARSVDNLQAKNFFENWLQPYQYSISPQKSKITGYYEPEIEGALSQSAEYSVPVYGKPSDLEMRRDVDGKIQYGMQQNGVFIPYYSRAQIDQGALQGKNLEVAWLKDPADLFFMQIQGSGRIILPDGRIVRMAYAGKNGHPYTALGKILVQQGLMNENDVNMYSLRNWLHNHPEQAKSLMEQNVNYVFFRQQNNGNTNIGPNGSFGLPLVAGRSVAVDKEWIPLGAPLWVETTMPMPPNAVKYPWKHMVFAQDLGGGVTGINRIDLFTGWGKDAGWYAGLMNEKGKVFMLLPKKMPTQQ